MILNVFLGIAQIVLAVALIDAVFAQQGELGGVFGGGQSIHQTRRGVDRYCCRNRPAGSVFFILAIVNVILNNIFAPSANNWLTICKMRCVTCNL